MRIGIICAIPNEMRYFNFSENTIKKIGKRKFYKGTQDKHELILVQSGLGKVNAAVVSTLLIEKFDCEFLLFSGVAGGIDPNIEIGEVIIGDSLIQYDYGTLKNKELLSFRPGRNPTGKPKNELEYNLDPIIKHKIKVSIPNIRMGKILTGDVFLECVETKKELFKNLYFLKKQPNEITYEISYYKKRWGFCISYNQYKKFNRIYSSNDKFKIIIDSTLNYEGKLNYGELILRGKSKQEILI